MIRLLKLIKKKQIKKANNINNSYKVFKKLFNGLTGEPEITITIGDKKYMLIKFNY